MYHQTSKKEIQVILDHLGLNICNTDCYMGYKTNMCYKGCKLKKIIDNIYDKFKKEVEEND